MSGALASNAGDRYHFIYTARRMIDMLYPRNDLKMIVMENVAQEDIDLGNGFESFLGVDLTEYYGGDSSDKAEKIVIVQVKYSPIHPNNTWTLNRLLKKKTINGKEKPASSVLRKLTDAFSAFYNKFKERTSEKIQIKLLSNQSLNSRDRDILDNIKSMILNKTNKEGSKILNKMQGNQKRYIDKFKDTTKLSGIRLASFIKSWDLNGFGQALLSEVEAQLYYSGSQIHSDFENYFGTLINFIQEHAIPNRKTLITKEKILALLRMREEDFFPCPTPELIIDNLIITKEAYKVEKEIQSMGKGFLLIHGFNGTGKSTLLEQLKINFEYFNQIIKYDCFNDGYGTSPGLERFPYDKFFTQIINEIDSIYHTNIISTTKLEYDHILARFRESLKKAALLANEKGKKLIIAIDAIDDAKFAQKQAYFKKNSFIELLWEIELPENCIFLITARTQNIIDLELQCKYEEIEISGFSEDETKKFLHKCLNLEDPTLQNHIFEKTKGNPRNLTILIEKFKLETPDDLFTFFEKEARNTIFDFYDKELNKIFKDKNSKAFLGVILESRGLITTNILCNILNYSPKNIKMLKKKLYFGINFSENGEIKWKDKDFFDFSIKFTNDIINDVREKLASYCIENFNRNSYSNLNLSHHLFRSARYEELLDFWLIDNRIQKYIEQTQPFKEKVLLDLQYTLQASIEVDNLVLFLKLLILTIDIFEGNNIFNRVMELNPIIAIQCNYLNNLLNNLYKDKYSTLNIPKYFEIAAALSRSEDFFLAKQLFQLSLNIIERYNTQYPDYPYNYIENDCVRSIAIYKANIEGLAFALQWIKSISLEPRTYEYFKSIIKYWVLNRDVAILETIDEVDINKYQEMICYFTLLSFGNEKLEKKEILNIFQRIINLERREESFLLKEIQDLIPIVCENLIQKKLIKEVKILLDFWIDFDLHDPVLYTINEYFLKKKAFEEILNIKSFNPKEIKLNNSREIKTPNYIYGKEEKFKKIFSQLYPSILLKIRSFYDLPEEETIIIINKLLERWPEEGFSSRSFYDSFHYFALNVFEVIISLSNYYGDLVSKILEKGYDLNKKIRLWSFIKFCEILLKDNRYYGIIEQHVINWRKELNSLNTFARENIIDILNLYYIAAKINKELANKIYFDLRIIANDIILKDYGITYSLYITGKNAIKENEISNHQIIKLLSIIENYKEVMKSTNVRINYFNLIYLISSVNLEYSFKLIKKLEKTKLYVPYEELYYIFKGILKAEKIPASYLFSLSNFVESHEVCNKIFFKIMSNIKYVNDKYLNNYFKIIKNKTPRWEKEKYLKEILDWAKNNSIESEVVKKVEIFLNKFKKIQISKKITESKKLKETLESDFFNLLFKAGKKSPLEALKLLLEADPEQILRLSSQEFKKINTIFLKSLTSSQIVKIFPIIKIWSVNNNTNAGFKYINKIVERFGFTNEISEEINKISKEIITTSFIQRNIANARLEFVKNLQDFDNRITQILLKRIQTQVVESLNYFHSDELFLLVSQLSIFLNSKQNYELFNILLDYATKGMELIEYPDIDKTHNQLKALIHFISYYLGHPRINIRWKALYTLKDIIIEEKNETIKFLIEEMSDQSQERWISKLEWVCFLFHHLSLKIPSYLKKYSEFFFNYLVNNNFPHAKIRYHLKHTLLNIENNEERTLTVEQKDTLELLNMPKAYYYSREYSLRQKYDNIPWREKKNTSFTFDFIDTLPYWYSPLSHCFGLHRCDIADIAYNWIVNKWEILEDMCIKDKKEQGYRYPETSNNHGTEPSVESLKIYAERHGMFMAAGELIDSSPVLFYKGHFMNQWEEWMRYRLRAADPSLPSENLEAPPLNSENYGYFSRGYEEWIKIVDEDFKNELFITDQPNRLVVSSNRKYKFNDRFSSIKVMSGLINPKTAASFIRLMQTEERITFFPYISIDNDYDTILNEYLRDYKNLEENSFIYENYQNIVKFKLNPWLIYWHQELPLHSDDPKWLSHSRDYYFLGIKFCELMGITWKPDEFKWYKNNEKVADLQIWNEIDNPYERNSDYNEGHRLSIEKNILCDFLKKMQLNLVFIVYIERNQPYHMRESYWDSNKGTLIKLFSLNQNGELKLMKN